MCKLWLKFKFEPTRGGGGEGASHGLTARVLLCGKHDRNILFTVLQTN